MSNSQTNNNNNSNHAYGNSVPLIFMIFDGSLLVSSFMVGLLGMFAVNVASVSVNLQQFLQNQRNNLKSIYDVSNIDFGRLLQNINEMTN